MLAAACLFNLANELGDVAVTAVPLARREGITRPALLSMLTASLVAWTMS